jgi:hypothetical protein
LQTIETHKYEKSYDEARLYLRIKLGSL